jgi:NADH-quinone oxidoreductase subunit I
VGVDVTVVPDRSRGTIVLHEDSCTSCMVCARECPDWCIYIDSHKETELATEEGARPQTKFVLDRFAIDYALCMYCGICIDTCPWDALSWSADIDQSAADVLGLTHEKERLGA